MFNERQRRGLAAVAAVLVCLTVPRPSWAAEPQAVESAVIEVTLYRGQAQVTREVALPQAAGSLELVVGGLPQYVVPDSLFAESTEAVQVRAVRYRSRAVGEEPREEVRELDVQIQDLADQLALNAQLQQATTKRMEQLDRLEGFVAPTAQSDLARGVLNAEALERLTQFAFGEREQALQRQVELQREERELHEQQALLQRRRAELTSGAMRQVHEAVLFLEKPAEGPQAVRLTYLVGRCGWSPAYNFRVSGEDRAVAIDYHAVVQQMSGEDWREVALTLSTASPTLSAAAPALAPFHVALAAGAPPEGEPAGQVAQQFEAYRHRQAANVREQNAAVSNRANLDISWQMNEAANDLSVLELNVDKDALAAVMRDRVTLEEGPSLSYPLPGRVSLASRADQQMLRIARADLEARLYHVAAPVLSSQVYREAELVNSSEEDLLAGPVAVYLDGRFVGRTEIPTVARGQTFVVGFGADPQLRCDRELVDRQESVQGGNQVLSFRYRLTVENYKDQAVPVRLLDRLPYAGHGEDLRATLAEQSDPLSEDALYLRLDRPKGVLRWDLEVAARAAGETARVVEYAYRLEFDRNRRLTTPSGSDAAAAQQEFEEMQMQRLKQ